MKVYDTRDVGNLIRIRRKKLGYTQKYLSEYTGLSMSYISELENGKETIEMGKAILLINLLGMDIDITSRGEK